MHGLTTEAEVEQVSESLRVVCLLVMANKPIVLTMPRSKRMRLFIMYYIAVSFK